MTLQSTGTVAFLDEIFKRDGALDHWQALIGALVALGGALIGGYLIHRQIVAADKLELERRRRKFSATRAVLPLTLSSISDYATNCGSALQQLYIRAVGERFGRQHDLTPLPVIAAPTIRDLKELIEFSMGDVHETIGALLAQIQVQQSRLADLWHGLQSPEHRQFDLHYVEEIILDTASIYAWASSLFSFARRETDQVPRVLDQRAMLSSLDQIGFRSERVNRIRETIRRRYGEREERNLEIVM